MKEQIESILNQRGNFELDLWVRDDGSTDATKKILMQYEIEKIIWMRLKFSTETSYCLKVAEMVE